MVPKSKNRKLKRANNLLVIDSGPRRIYWTLLYTVSFSYKAHIKRNTPRTRLWKEGGKKGCKFRKNASDMKESTEKHDGLSLRKCSKFRWLSQRWWWWLLGVLLWVANQLTTWYIQTAGGNVMSTHREKGALNMYGVPACIQYSQLCVCVCGSVIILCDACCLCISGPSRTLSRLVLFYPMLHPPACYPLSSNYLIRVMPRPTDRIVAVLIVLRYFRFLNYD